MAPDPIGWVGIGTREPLVTKTEPAAPPVDKHGMPPVIQGVRQYVWPSMPYPAPRPKVPPAAGIFEVVLWATVISDRTVYDGHAKVIYGEVAWLPDDRLIARYRSQNLDGSVCYAYQPYDPDQDPRDVVTSPAIDWMVQLEARISRSRVPFNTLSPLPQSENDRFDEEYPQLAGELGKAPTLCHSGCSTWGPCAIPGSSHTVRRWGFPSTSYET